MPPKTTSPHGEPGPDQAAIAALALAVVALAGALIVGIFARLHALGSAPLAVDEYFIVRSVQNLLRHGLPQFDCGGLYSRGLILQYGAALIERLGSHDDVAPRLVSAVSSLATLPAAYLLGRRVHGPVVGALAVMVLALSVWEIEMARFGRMYAPFQAVFLWYLVFFLRRTVDRDVRAEWALIALTIVGSLLWEGGVFLALANFLPVFLERRSLKLSPQEWLSLVKFVPVLAAAYWFVTADLRMLSDAPALPPDYDPSLANDTPADALVSGTPLWSALLANRVWLTVALVPLGMSIWSWVALWRRRKLDWTVVGLMATLASALAHQFVAAAAVLLLWVLLRFSSLADLRSRAARAVYVAVAAWALFWLAFRHVSWNPPHGMRLSKTVAAYVFPLMSFPDVIDQVLRPWAGAVPMLGLGLLLLLSLMYVHVVRRDEPGVSAERALLAVSLCLLLAACASNTPRHETRYIFFLYPAAVVLALAMIALLVERVSRPGPIAALVTSALALGAFMLGEDFQPRHLIEIGRAQTALKLDMRPALQAHLVVREDSPELARWLMQHASAPDDVVISAFQSLDYYDPKVDFFYVDRRDFNYESYACRLGTIDRWSNRPLLESVAGIERVAASRPHTYLVTYAPRVPALLAELSRYHASVAWSVGHLSVVALSPPGVSSGGSL
jgi:hypothetical protein